MKCLFHDIHTISYRPYETNFTRQSLNNTVYEWTSYNQVHQIASKLEFGPRFWEIVSNLSIRRSDWLKSRLDCLQIQVSLLRKNNKIKAKWKVILIKSLTHIRSRTSGSKLGNGECSGKNGQIVKTGQS